MKRFYRRGQTNVNIVQCVVNEYSGSTAELKIRANFASLMMSQCDCKLASSSVELDSPAGISIRRISESIGNETNLVELPTCRLLLTDWRQNAIFRLMASAAA